MSAVVTCEFRFFRTPDGKIWTSSAFPRAFWDRYLEVFDTLTVVARVKECHVLDPNWKRVDGDNVSIVALPHYIGPIGLLKNMPAIIKTLRQVIRPDVAVIYRVPSQTAMISTFFNSPKTPPYSLEVVGDPADVFSSGIVNPFLDKLFGLVSKRALQKMAANALAVSYVTQDYLQRNYPPSSNAFTIGCSSIELTKDNIRNQPKHFQASAKNLLFIGSFGQLYKGADVLIKALAKLQSVGHQYQLTLLGDGRYKEDMIQLGKEFGCSKALNFVGEVSAEQVKRYIQGADVFIMPSRTEGLPRALIEAMAEGLPAIGSSVGGIPELLTPEFLFESENVDMLADKIASLCESVTSLNTQSLRNLNVARQYEASILAHRRKSFYQYIKNNQ